MKIHQDHSQIEGEHEVKNDKKMLLVSIVTAGILAFAVIAAVAKDMPADNMQIVREKVKADKKLFVATNMELTESEAEAFWPVYEDYQDELFLLRARTEKLIQDYARAFENMTEEKAKVLLDEYMTVEALGLEVRRTYLPKFRKILPEKKVARYYQIENKIEKALYHELAIKIPLVQ